MAGLQAAKRVELNYDGIGKVDFETAMGLEFDLAGDRRKIEIVARSCVK
ncbi:Periplasmic protein-like (fragment) [Bradyrhizobium sp. ORS 375]